ncbi:hypothetical protein RvY_09444 [Ramazzottius varieornatus]|uniref:Uncharacterized protein n=1 Tax=Ramazzottius varieornatus TaxID=947166 RepID=A0A1D1VBT1_RAMVA|nr:hypothetical protein RvY_09444 [Ramazzottius varieornatus]
MNWIPKEKAHSKKPSEKDKIKEYFRKHRRTLGIAATEVAVQNSDGREPDKRSRSVSRSRTSDSSSPLKSPSPKPPPFTAQVHSSRRSKRGTPVQGEQLPLADMDLRGLAEVIKDPSNISTDLVHLELMKRMFGYRPRTEPESPTAEQGLDTTVYYTNDESPFDLMSRSAQVIEEAPRKIAIIRPENQLNWTDPGFSNIEDQNLDTSNLPTDYERESNFAERSAEEQSKVGSSYWDLTDLTRATNPRQHLPRSFFPF